MNRCHFYDKIYVLQKHLAIRTNVDRTITVVGAIGGTLREVGAMTRTYPKFLTGKKTLSHFGNRSVFYAIQGIADFRFSKTNVKHVSIYIHHMKCASDLSSSIR